MLASLDISVSDMLDGVITNFDQQTSSNASLSGQRDL